MTDLLPCPFCGSDTIMSNTGTCWVSCTNCCAEGPTADSEELAASRWNSRPKMLPDLPQTPSTTELDDPRLYHYADPPASAEIGWLIEWPEDDNVPVRWWNPAHGWMRDANKALRFARQTDADCYLSTMRFGQSLKTTEHKFVCSVSRPKREGD